MGKKKATKKVAKKTAAKKVWPKKEEPISEVTEKRVPKPDAKEGPIDMILKRGYITNNDKTRVIGPGEKFKADEMDPQRLKELESRGLIERLTTEKKKIVKK